MRVLKIQLYEIGVCRCIIYDFFSIINEIILLVYGNILAIVTVHSTKDDLSLSEELHHSYVISSTILCRPSEWRVGYISLRLQLVVLDKY